MWIIFSILSTLLYSIYQPTFKRALLAKWDLSRVLFKIYDPSILLLAFLLLIPIWIISINYDIFQDYTIILIIWIISALGLTKSILLQDIFKKLKVSESIPYQDLDKVFIVIIWYFIFYWTENWSSILTVIITLFSIVLIILFNYNPKKKPFSKEILLLVLVKFINAIFIISAGYVIMKYGSISFSTVLASWEMIFLFLSIIILGDSLKNLFSCNKDFHRKRITATFLGLTSFIFSLFVIESVWVIVATMLGFLGIITTILSSYFIDRDKPKIKDITLGFLVLALIWAWYYFK